MWGEKSLPSLLTCQRRDNRSSTTLIPSENGYRHADSLIVREPLRKFWMGKIRKEWRTVFEECLSMLCQVTKAARDPKSRRSHGQRAPKTSTNWMQKRARKRGKYLQFQRLFYLHRGRLAWVILDNTKALKYHLVLSTLLVNLDGKHQLISGASSPSCHRRKQITPFFRP